MLKRSGGRAMNYVPDEGSGCSELICGCTKQLESVTFVWLFTWVALPQKCLCLLTAPLSAEGKFKIFFFL